MTMPETPVQKQAERTPEGQFAKGFSGNLAGRPPGCRNHATRTAEVVDAYIRAIEASDFDRRLKALEAANAADL